MSNPSGPRCLLRSGTSDQALERSLATDWVFIFMEQALEGKDVKDMLLNVGSGGGAAAAPAAGGAGGAGGAGATAAEEKAEEKEEEKEESDEDMGFGLFD